jgi:hypothetical protein
VVVLVTRLVEEIMHETRRFNGRRMKQEAQTDTLATTFLIRHSYRSHLALLQFGNMFACSNCNLRLFCNHLDYTGLAMFDIYAVETH